MNLEKIFGFMKNKKVIIEGGYSGSFSKSYVVPYKLPILKDTTRIISTYIFDLIYENQNGLLVKTDKELNVQKMNFVPYLLERPVSIIVADGRIFTDKNFFESDNPLYNVRLKMFLEEIDYKNNSFKKLYKTAGGVYA